MTHMLTPGHLITTHLHTHEHSSQLHNNSNLSKTVGRFCIRVIPNTPVNTSQPRHLRVSELQPARECLPFTEWARPCNNKVVRRRMSRSFQHLQIVWLSICQILLHVQLRKGACHRHTKTIFGNASNGPSMRQRVNLSDESTSARATGTCVSAATSASSDAEFYKCVGRRQ